MDLRSFFDAIDRGDLEPVRAALAAEPGLANAVAEPGWFDDAPPRWTALHHAGKRGRVEVARALIEAGADLEARSGEGRGWRTALHDSFEYGRPRITELLLASGAYLDVSTAAGLGRIERVRELLDQDPALANDPSNGLEPLGWAAYGNQAEVVHLLIDRGARVRDELCCAARCGHVGSGTALLDRGADPNVLSAGGWTPLHHAAAMQFTDDAAPFVRLVLERGGDAGLRDSKGQTPIEVARARLEQESRAGMRRGYEAVIAALSGPA